MSNPWMLDDDDIPDDPRTRRQKRRLQVVGVCLWGLVIGMVSILLASDPRGLTAVQALLLGVIVIVLAIVAISIGWLLSAFLRRFGFGGRLLLGVVLFLVFLSVFPILLSFVFENVSVFDSLSTDSGGFIEWLFDLLR